jgi:hypothetical protein
MRDFLACLFANFACLSALHTEKAWPTKAACVLIVTETVSI